MRFHEFYDDAYHVLNISLNTCSTTLAAYERNPTQATCNAQYSCILSNAPQPFLATAASAGVLLGLTPTILQTMGPSFAEVALLAAYRPFLTVLLSIGTPTVPFERAWQYTDPRQSMSVGTGRFNIPQSTTTWKTVLLGLLEYICAAGAAANVIANVVQLGHRSVLNWACQSSIYPLVWALIPLFMHLLNSVAFRVSRVGRAMRNKESGRRRQALWERVRRAVAKELTPCWNRQPFDATDQDPASVQPDKLAISMQGFCQLVSVLHIAFGSVVLASLLFVHTLAAMEIVLRFLLSAAVCRLIVILEIGGLRSRLTNDASLTKPQHTEPVISPGDVPTEMDSVYVASK